MRKILIIPILLSFTFIVKSQINLEHKFENSTQGKIHYFNTENSTFFSVVSANNQVKIFNSDYSLYKTVTISLPTEYSETEVKFFLFSTKLFNMDEKIEFLVSYYLNDGSTDNFSLALYDEDGVILKDFGPRDTSEPSIIKTAANQVKLRVDRCTVDITTNPKTYNYSTDIYSLPGNVPNNIISFESMQNSSAFPNPAKTTVNLPYRIDKNQTAFINIYNMKGQLVERKQIDAQFDKIALNISAYSSGTYIYEYNGKSNRFIVN